MTERSTAHTQVVDSARLSTEEIRRLATYYDGPNLITQTIPALCNEVDRLRAECERLHRLAYFTIRLPWRKR